MRDGLAELGQLRPWFDANELPPSYPWSSPMLEAARTNTAALVSIVTDAYPTRHWCRREAREARTPRRLGDFDPQRLVLAWTVQPTVAILHPGALWSAPMAQLAQVPHVGWAAATQKARVEDVIDRLLLEALLVEFYRRYAAIIQRAFGPAASGAPSPEGTESPTRTESPRSASQGCRIAFITWVPEPWTLARLVGDLAEVGGVDTWFISQAG